MTKSSSKAAVERTDKLWTKLNCDLVIFCSPVGKSTNSVQRASSLVLYTIFSGENIARSLRYLANQPYQQMRSGCMVTAFLRIRRLRIGLSAMLALPATFAHAGSPESTRPTQLNEDFQFQLYTADVFGWASGDRSGKITETKGDMANGLEAVLIGARSRLDIALYGVHKQNWFLDVVEQKRENSEVRVRAVVDQNTGEVGDWSTSNFVYGDTVKLARILDHTDITPDLNRDGTTRRSSIMHNKFVVADRRTVWLGTANVTHTEVGSEYNANAAIVVRSPALARIYSDEFTQMFERKLFSRQKWERLDRSPLQYRDGTRAEVFFSPQDDAVNRGIIPFIKRARRTLDIAMFFLTHDAVSEELMAAKRRGVQVRLIYDALAAAHPYTDHLALREAGIDVRVENWGGKMHMKTAVADGKDVVIGSLNWSVAGNEENDENTLIVRDNPRLGSELSSYYERLWTSLEPSDQDRSGRGGRDPRAEGWDSINSCIDGLDNDHDGLVDEDDPACR